MSTEPKDRTLPQFAPRGKRIYWILAASLAACGAAAAFWAAREDAKNDLFENRLEAQVRHFLLNPPEEKWRDRRSKAERERDERIREILPPPESEHEGAEVYDYAGAIKELRAREVEALRQFRQTSEFIESLIERDVRTFEIRIPAASRNSLLTSSLTKNLFREPKLEEYLERHHVATLPIAGGIAGLLWGMAISWAATYPSLGWRRVSITLGVMGFLIALCYPSDRATPLDRLGASVGIAVILPLTLLLAREVVLWIMRGFRARSASPPTP